MFALAKHDIYSVLNCDDEHVFLNFAVSQSVNFSDIKYGIPKLRSDNYKIWKERVLLHLGCMDVDYAIKKKEPSVITETHHKIPSTTLIPREINL